MRNKIVIYDSTLRDGAQAEGISFSLDDKIKIVAALDDMGIDYIEAGNPASNPKDAAFYDYYKKNPSRKPKFAKLTAFGSTRKKGVKTGEDKNVLALLEAETDVVCIVGKCSRFHVEQVIQAECDENIQMIRETIAFFKERGRRVIFDGEHFFDGWGEDKDYAMECIAAAESADTVVLCDTNGGAFPLDIYSIVKKVSETFTTPLGIHTHNDCGMAVANSIMAVEAGAVHVQGTFIGFGERCGNACLSTIIPNLRIKKGYNCLNETAITHLTPAARYIAEIANISLDERSPYIGKSAFAHKGGMHVDGVFKCTQSFEHIDPILVGNERKHLLSEVAGRSAVLSAIQRIDPDIKRDSMETDIIVKHLKKLENDGYQFEAAESSFILGIRKILGKYKPSFELINYKAISEQPCHDGSSASAIIKIIVDGKTEITAADGKGPVNALDKALRKALEVFYPQLKNVHLTDYKVRVLDGKPETASMVRVLIESTDGKSNWTTVGVSHDIIEASWIALVDSIEYKLIKDME